MASSIVRLLGPSAALLLLLACSDAAAPTSSDAPAGAPDPAAPAGDAGLGGDASAADAGSGADAGGAPGLPFPYARPPAGAPVSAAELTAITDTFIDLLTKTRYFDVLDERVHGWPRSDPQKRYWYGTWWSGVGLTKALGKVTFAHVDVGADNNGIGTSLVLEGVCLAHRQWPSPKLERLTRRLIRGFNSWILAMQRSAADPAGTLLARVAYPAPIASTDDGRTAFIDYAPDRPGIDSYTQYVHLATNPSWGDIWIKNKRSKDDIGHMLRAIATLQDCAGGLGADTQADLAEMRAGYVKWAQRVEAEAWSIATLDKNGNLWTPPLTETMSHFITAGNAECDAVTALRLFGKGNPGSFDCGSGIHPLEAIALTNDSNGEIVRSFHEAAVRHALAARQDAMAKTLLAGLTTRIEDGMTRAEAGSWPAHLDAEKLVKLIVLSANTGVPLTSREVRWVHSQLRLAHASYVTNTPPAVYRVFDPATPDGGYVFTPEGEGIDFRFLAALAGTCVAGYRNPTTMPLLDCSRLKAWTP
ncbi:MAG TPA: hypothetical protein VLT33_25150 [Labilithrix sp.]|nr:hypothetical protein [Labilithrix sp.]